MYTEQNYHPLELKKKSNIFIRQKQDIGGNVHKTGTLGCKIWVQKWQLCERFMSTSFKWCDFSTNFIILFHLLNTFYQVIHQTGAYPRPQVTRGSFAPPWMWCYSIAGYPFVHLGGGGTARVKCLAYEHNTISLARAWSLPAHCLTAWYGDMFTSYEATAKLSCMCVLTKLNVLLGILPPCTVDSFIHLHVHQLWW